MIAKLTGVVDSVSADGLVLDVAGVGYQVFCSARTLGAVDGLAGPVSLLVDTHVREDHIHLYGFADVPERDAFRLLTTVQGVGAKVGLALLSAIAADQLASAVAAGDTALLTQAPGVGRKLAQRIVSELKEKVGGLGLAVALEGAAPAASGPLAAAGMDAVSALVNLGYGRTEAFGAVSRALGDLGPEAGVESLIRAGLGELAPADGGARP